MNDLPEMKEFFETMPKNMGRKETEEESGRELSPKEKLEDEIDNSHAELTKGIENEMLTQFATTAAQYHYGTAAIPLKLLKNHDLGSLRSTSLMGTI